MNAPLTILECQGASAVQLVPRLQHPQQLAAFRGTGAAPVGAAAQQVRCRANVAGAPQQLRRQVVRVAAAPQGLQRLGRGWPQPAEQ